MKPSVKLVNNYTIGADIEGFLKNKETGEIVSAEGFVKGTKNLPYQFDPSNRFYATSLDNVLAEICIPPAKECKGFIEGINKSFGFVSASLPPHLCIAHIPSAVLNPEYLTTDQAKIFGCEPDYNVWKRCINEKPIAENPNLRSSGFHVHVGFDDPTPDTVEKCVRAMDLFLSVPSILLEPDNERRKLYGKAGAFRFKDYGFEHRVLSGYFASNDNLKSWVFDNTIRALETINGGGYDAIDAVGELIQEAVNNNNKLIAGNLVRQFDIPLN